MAYEKANAAAAPASKLLTCVVFMMPSHDRLLALHDNPNPPALADKGQPEVGAASSVKAEGAERISE
jgi:hypothetical protein